MAIPFFSKLIFRKSRHVPPRGKTRRSLWFGLWGLCYGSPGDVRMIRYRLGELAARWIGDCWVGEDLKLWLQDAAFLQAYQNFEPHNRRSAERKFVIRELVRSLADVPGDTVECGALAGATSYFICLERPQTTHHIFDSFQGLPAPDRQDTPQYAHARAWKQGELSSSLQTLQTNLAEFERVAVYPGWIPSRFDEVATETFCFVHIDVDLYQPTLESLQFFYPRTAPGGIIVCDDYGYLNCGGAKQACDEFLAGRPESLIHLPTGQGVIFRR